MVECPLRIGHSPAPIIRPHSHSYGRLFESHQRVRTSGRGTRQKMKREDRKRAEYCFKSTVSQKRTPLYSVSSAKKKLGEFALAHK